MLKLTTIGHLGKDCTVNTVNGKNVINFTLAHTEKYTDSQGNKQEKTTWIDCSYWTDRTAIAPYLTKGKQLWIEGTPDVRSFTRNDGTAGAALAVRVREIQLIGGNANVGQQSAPAAQASQPQQQTAPVASPAASTTIPAAANANDIADDLPF